MKEQIVATSPSAAPSCPERRPYPMALRLLWIVPCAALLCLLLFLSIGRTRLSEAGQELVFIFDYCICIGPPSAYLCNWIGHRYSDRYPRLVILFYTIALLATATAGTLMSGLLLQWMKQVPRSAYWQQFQGSWLFSIVVTLMVGLSISIFETLRSKLQRATIALRTQQVEQERANKLLAEAQLSSLESRIHPHFLFNTLNSIAALIPTDPARAEDTVAKLASLLRFSLHAQHNGLAPLAQELKVVRDYLEIEKTRFGPRLRYEIFAPGNLDSVRIPPLALQTVVENSVKYAVAQRAEGASIRIAAALETGRVQLEVVDNGPGFSPDAIAPGHGLGNLVARLDLLFGPAGRLTVARENDMTVVRMSFPAES